MARNVLSPRVREFLSAHVTRVADLQVLLVLIDGGHRWWDAEGIAMRTGTDPSTARRILESFAARNLLDIGVSDVLRYRLHAGSDDLARALEQVAAAYKTSPTAIVSFVSGNHRTLAEADSRTRKRRHDAG